MVIPHLQSSETLQDLQSLAPEISRRIKSLRSEQGINELLRDHPELQPVLLRLMNTITTLVGAYTSPDKTDAEFRTEAIPHIKTHPELLTAEADALLGILVDKQIDEDNKDKVLMCRVLLASCRRGGIEAAFDSMKCGDTAADENDVRVLWDSELFRLLDSVRSEQDLYALLAKRPEAAPLAWDLLDIQEYLRAELNQLLPEATQILAQLSLPVSDSEQEAGRLQLFERAFALVHRHRTPHVWANLQHQLGTAERKGFGNSENNLERAIEAFYSALEVWSRADFPTEWATTQASLAAAWRERIHGDRAENFENAIDAYNAALKVSTRADHPEDWAGIQNNLGTVFRVRARGERADNLECAIAHYHAALEVYTRNDFSVDWAMTQSNLANVLRERILGDRAENVEQAIAAYHAALEVRTRHEFPVEWAKTQHNLGTAFRERVSGDRAKNLTDAIAACEAALEVFTRSQYPVDWALTQLHLSLALAAATHGLERPVNPEEAIAACKNAMEVLTESDHPVDWAAANLVLARALLATHGRERAENLERASAACKAALRVYTRNGFPFDWALTQQVLGDVLAGRIHGDPAENQEGAIKAHGAALEAFTPDHFPEEGAWVHNLLGLVFRERIRGNRAENVEHAIDAFEAALQVFTKEEHSDHWAGIQINLANTLSERIEGDRAHNLEGALDGCRAALEVFTRSNSPTNWALTQATLGNVMRERTRGDPLDNLEQAIVAYTDALQVYTRADFPMEFGVTQCNLGSVLAERDEQSHDLTQAVAAYRAAIKAARAVRIKDYERRAARGLGNLHYDQGQWPDAYQAFDTAVAALEAMRTEYFSEESKTKLAAENAQLYARLTDTCLHLGRRQEALEWVEASKGRLLLDQLGYDAVPAPALSSAQKPLLEEEATLLTELRSLENAKRNAANETERRELLTQQGAKRTALEDIWARLQSNVPAYVALRRGDPVEYEHLQAMVDSYDCDAALVEFYVYPEKIIVFVLRSGEAEPACEEVPMSEDQLRRHTENYWREVAQYGQRGDMGQRWQKLGDPLLGDVLPHLQRAQLVYLVPHGLLHYLPLHALRVNDEYLIDRFPIAYVPSAATLNRVLQRTARAKQTGGDGRSALVLGYTPYERERRVFEGEARQVAEYFGTAPHLDADATAALLRERGAEFDILHMSCHGFFHPTHPLESGLKLADQTLTARAIMALRLNADLVTLSACETAINHQQPGDELVGLTQALLYAGASSVMATLWPVDAESALSLMDDFYSRLGGDAGTKVQQKAVALQDAMLEMRNKRDHPFYWAPFILVGDWR